jgi:hypothetical protein
MSAGNPFDWAAWYSVLKYKFPLNEQHAVVRIPVAGPEPFNTLAVVRAHLGLGQFGWASGTLDTQDRGPVSTSFVLAGQNDPRREPASQHSTTAFLNHQQLDAGDAWSPDGLSPFVNAFNAVLDGRFVFNGAGWQWSLWWNDGTLADNVLASASVYVSSWVLCWEPPEDDYPSRGGGTLGPLLRRPFDPSRTTLDKTFDDISGPRGKPSKRRKAPLARLVRRRVAPPQHSVHPQVTGGTSGG